MNVTTAQQSQTPSENLRINMVELKKLMKAEQNTKFIDTRGDYSQSAEKIPGAVRIDTEDGLKKLSSSDMHITYCT